VATQQLSLSLRPRIQSNNVETDERGFIYLVDRAGTGLSVLKLSESVKTASKAENSSTESPDR
jgi:hypothetical protein